MTIYAFPSKKLTQNTYETTQASVSFADHLTNPCYCTHSHFLYRHPDHGIVQPSVHRDFAASNKTAHTKTRRTAEKVCHIPTHLKATMTIREAAEYSNVGINKIDALLKLPNCPFVLYVGTKKLVKRKAFEEFIEHRTVI